MKKLFCRLFLLTALVTACSVQDKQEGRNRQDKPFINSYFADIDGMILHYRLWPATSSSDSLPWILLVHGFGGSTWSWEKNAPVLASSGFNVIAVDVPPFGYSGKDPDFNQSVDSRAGLIWKFLNSIRPGLQWHLVGHSMGGGIIQAMAILNPDQVGKVVFTDPALFSNLSVIDKKRRSLLNFKPIAWIAAGLGKAVMVRPKSIKKMLLSAYGQEPEPGDVEEYYKALSQKGFALALIRSTAESHVTIPIDGKAFNKPAIAIWGDQDTWVPLEQMKPLLDQLPTIKVIVIDGAGHLPMVTHPELFNNEVLRFLR